MVINQEIKEENFKFCPKCGCEIIKTKVTCGYYAGRDVLLCTKCGDSFLLQLAFDMG